MITVVDKHEIMYDNGDSKHGDNGNSGLDLGLQCGSVYCHINNQITKFMGLHSNSEMSKSCK